MQSYSFVGSEILFGMMKTLWGWMVEVAQQYVDSKLKGSFSTTQIHYTASTVSLLGHSDHHYVQLT